MKLVIFLSASLCLAVPLDGNARGPLFADLSAGANDARIVASRSAGMTRLSEPAWV